MRKADRHDLVHGVPPPETRAQLGPSIAGLDWSDQSRSTSKSFSEAPAETEAVRRVGESGARSRMGLGEILMDSGGEAGTGHGC